MSKCKKCGRAFVGTAAHPPPDDLCHICERALLRLMLRSEIGSGVTAMVHGHIEALECELAACREVAEKVAGHGLEARMMVIASTIHRLKQSQFF